MARRRMSAEDWRALPVAEREARGEQLKERIYITFASLAVVVTLGAHGHVTAGEALFSLVVTALGAVLAVFTADVISHLVIHGRMLTRGEMVHAVLVTFGALSAVTIPVLMLLAAAAGWWSPEAALRGSAIALVVALVAFGALAIRSVKLTWWQRLLVLAAEAVLGCAVIALQLLAHA